MEKDLVLGMEIGGVEGDIASKPRRKKGTQHGSRRRREATWPPHGFKLSTILREARRDGGWAPERGTKKRRFQ